MPPSDTTAPTFDSINLSPSTVDLGRGQGKVTVTAHFHDDVSGVFDGTFNGAISARPQIRFVSPSGQLVDGVFDILHPVSGSQLDGVYAATLTLAPQAA